MWTDAGNIAAYAYPGTGGIPAKLSTWINDPKVGVYTLLPNASTVPPVVTVTAPSANGAQVMIQVFWRMPEEASQTPLPPPHTYTVVATIFTS